jgi:hypothetical protein
VEIFASQGAPPVSTTPVAKFATAANDTGGAPWAANISENCRKILNRLYIAQGLGGNWFMEKTWSRKSRGTVLLSELSHTFSSIFYQAGEKIGPKMCGPNYDKGAMGMVFDLSFFYAVAQHILLMERWGVRFPPERKLDVLASPDLHSLVVEPQLSEPLLVDAEEAAYRR